MTTGYTERLMKQLKRRKYFRQQAQDQRFQRWQEKERVETDQDCSENDRTESDPSPEQIVERAAKIRKNWTETEYVRRRTGYSPDLMSD